MVSGCFGLSVLSIAIFCPRCLFRFCIVWASGVSFGYESAISRFCVQDIMAVIVWLSVSMVLRVPIGDIAVPALSEKERQILTNCLRVSVDSRTVDNKPAGLVNSLRELLESVKMVATSKDVDVDRLKKLPNLTFLFQFSRDKLVEEYELIKDGEYDPEERGSVFFGRRARFNIC